MLQEDYHGSKKLLPESKEKNLDKFLANRRHCSQRGKAGAAKLKIPVVDTNLVAPSQAAGYGKPEDCLEPEWFDLRLVYSDPAHRPSLKAASCSIPACER